MGYREVNLNVGCPSGTVVAKGKGAGMLGDPERLDRFLDEIFSAGLELDISVKTRLGLTEPEEFGELLGIFNQYPISLLIVHPRVRKDYYREPVRTEEFEAVTRDYRGQLCYNGGLVSAGDCRGLAERFPSVDKLMIGQGLIANPALARQARGGPAAQREELRGMHEELYRIYLKNFNSGRNTVFHMKELWSYQSRLFVGGEKLFKQIRKAQDTAAYESAVDQIFATLPLREDADWT